MILGAAVDAGASISEIDRALGQSGDFVRRQLGHGVRHDGDGQAGHAEALGLRLGQGIEFIAADGGGGDTVAFQFDAVMDTPRRA